MVHVPHRKSKGGQMESIATARAVERVDEGSRCLECAYNLPRLTIGVMQLAVVIMEFT